MPKTLEEIQHDAVVLSALLEGIDLMNNEGAAFDDARNAVTGIALEKARALANDMDRTEVRT